MDSVPTQSARSTPPCEIASAACISTSMPVPQTRCTMCAGVSIGTPE